MIPTPAEIEWLKQEALKRLAVEVRPQLPIPTFEDEPRK